MRLTTRFVGQHQLSSSTNENDDAWMYSDCITGCMIGLPEFKFPSSAKQLKKDHGLFQGPRPGVCYNVGYKKLPTLGIVLTHDDSALRWKRALDNPLVFGIRELKGLEFKSVIILDFFCELPSELQKPWRDLVLNRADIDFAARHPLVENMLKL
jgi:hypothetical protein